MALPARCLGLLLCVALIALFGTLASAQTTEGSPFSLKGRLLVAEPELQDPNFEHTVVYMLNHDDRGAMGLVINRMFAEGPIGRLLEALGYGETLPDPERAIRVFYGGPVGRDQTFVLHTDDYHRTETVEVADGIAVTPSIEVVPDVAAGKGPRQSLLAIGYAGWSPGQLEREIGQGAWLIIDGDPRLVFDPDVPTKWARAFARRGVDL